MVFRSLALLVTAGVLLAGGRPALAQAGADLNVSPKRVVLAEGQRHATVHLFNQGDEAATYVIEMIDHRMTSTGDLVALGEGQDDTIQSSAPWLAYTPRRVLLQPGESQAIRIRARAPDVDGEYRTHLTITALPPAEAGLTASESAQGLEAEALSLQVVARFSLSIPVILRHGDVDAAVTLSQLRLLAPRQPQGLPGVAFQFNREGRRSLYGDVEIQAGAGAQARTVGRVRGVALYPEIERREFIVWLDQPIRSGELLHIIYRDDERRPGAELATATLVAP